MAAAWVLPSKRWCQTAASVTGSEPEGLTGVLLVGTGGPWAEAWLVREWCGHGTLTDAILKGWLQQKNSRSVNPIAVLATAAEVASALRCLHGQGVVHGDLCGDW